MDAAVFADPVSSLPSFASPLDDHCLFCADRTLFDLPVCEGRTHHRSPSNDVYCDFWLYEDGQFTFRDLGTDHCFIRRLG